MQVSLVFRVVWFAFALVMVVSVVLPWAALDGLPGSYSGVELSASVFSYLGDYLFGVSPVGAVTLIAVPVLFTAFAVFVVVRYAVARRVLYASLLSFGLLLAFYFVSGPAVEGFRPGFFIALVAAGALVAHQVLLVVQFRFVERRRLPGIYAAFRAVNGVR